MENKERKRKMNWIEFFDGFFFPNQNDDNDVQGESIDGRIPNGIHFCFHLHFILNVLIFKYNIKGVDDSGYKTQNGEGNVDNKIGTTSSFQKYTDWWKYDCQNYFTNIRTGERHFCSFFLIFVVDYRKILTIKWVWISNI